VSPRSSTFIRGSVLSTAGMLATLVFALVTTVVFTHSFDRANNGAAAGVYALLILLSELLSLLGNFGLTSTLPKLVASERDEDRSITARTCLQFQLITSVIFGIPIVLLWFLTSNPHTFSANPSWTSLFPYLWALPLLLVFGNLRENLLAALAGFDKYGARAIGLVATAIVNLLLVILFVEIFDWGLHGLVWATILSYIFGAVWFLASIPMALTIGYDWARYKKAINFSAPIYANNLLGFIFLRFDTFFIAWLMGPLHAAYFEFVSKRFPAYLTRILVAALTPFLPGMSALASNNSLSLASRLFEAVSVLFTVAGYTAVLVIVGVQDRLVGLLFPVEYAVALPAMDLVLAASVFNIQAGIAGLSLLALEKPKVIMTTNMAAAVLSLAFNAVLIPWMGMLGAGVAAVASGAFSNFAQMWLISRTGILFSWKRYALLHALAITFLLVSGILNPGILNVALPALFLILCYAAGLIRNVDIQVLMQKSEAQQIHSIIGEAE
jgi:O-antigen/teichoic acid export membrane protein